MSPGGYWCTLTIAKYIKSILGVGLTSTDSLREANSAVDL